MMKHTRRVFRSGLALLSLAACTTAGAAEPDWKAGLARVKITPEQPVMLAGYASRNKPFERVVADLYAKALALEDSQGHRVVLVTSDLIGFSAAVAEPICARVRERIGLPREHILLNAAHVHTGPSLSLDPTPRDGRAPGDAQRTVAYTRRLQDQVVELIVEAVSHLEPARLSWGTGVCSFVMNRREFTPNGVILGVNARGLADRTVPVLRVDAPDGKVRAVLFGAAVHNTTLTDKHNDVCGDYAGYAQAFVEEHHPGVQALFMTGCAGDANPYPRGSMELAREHGTTLGQEVGRVLETKLRPVAGPLQVAFERVELPLQQPLPRADLEKQAAGRNSVDAGIARQMLATLDRGAALPTRFACPFTVWQFGGDLTLVGLPGEVVVDYVSDLEKVLGPNRLWLAAYCNDVFGYLPSARVLREGGYETRGLYAGGIGRFAPEAEQVVVSAVRDLARKAGRKLP
jgi:hypothetical protein